MLQILWATGYAYDKDWEISWIKELLGNIEYKIDTLITTNQIIPNSIIVFNHNCPYYEYLLEYEKLKLPFGLIHLSDEFINDDCNVYNLTMCKFVFRNYYHKIFENTPKVHHFALGYKYDLWNDVLLIEKKNVATFSSKERQFDWNFLGFDHEKMPERRYAINLFKIIPNNKIVIETGNSYGQQLTGLKTPEYRQVLINSKFTLSPFGIKNIECFRLTESLECGSIPITINQDYWEKMFGEKPPFVMGNTWEESLNKVQNLLLPENQLTLEEMRITCCQFWRKYKNKISNKLAEKIKLLN